VSALVVVIAVVLDQFLGEPRRWHPLTAFGSIANTAESMLNTGKRKRLHGVLALLILLLPLMFMARWLSDTYGLVVDILLVYLAIGGASLGQHVLKVIHALQKGNLAQAREAVAMIVSRDTAELDETGVNRATIESLLENGADAVFGALFWFLLAGAPGVVAYRLVNTLDAMWGYRTERFEQFGWAAAKLDDLLNWIPARLTAVGYALAGNRRAAFRCWGGQASGLASPNGGVVMCAGAGSLGVTLGGSASYHGERMDKPLFGCGEVPRVSDIYRALDMLYKSLAIWLSVIVIGSFYFA
jgi:adenosylcobinamide-phosphate synthase